MADNIDRLLNGLRGSASGEAGADLDRLEAAVWDRIETHANNRRAMRTQFAVAALALVVGLAASQTLSVSAGQTADSESSVLSDDSSLALSMML